MELDKQVLTYLSLNEEQASTQLEINKEASEGVTRDDPGRILRLMSLSLNNALSPFLVKGSEPPKDYLDFVNNSPKIKYAVECIRTVKKWHESRNQEVSGQVIYIDRGKEFFPYIKQYLEMELGFKKAQKLKSNPRLKVDEIEFITSEISGKKKEKIKAAFNEGVCKVIIGTSTIREGINLQENATCLYNLYPNWNPTDLRQLEGRIWRQKNKFGYVRIVMPLMENSMDIFVFQKLEEKTSRINDLWNQTDRGNVLDEESLDPNQVKFALLTDLDVLKRFQIKLLKEENVAKFNIVNSQLESLGKYNSLEQKYNDYKNYYVKKIDATKQALERTEILSVPGQRIYYNSLSGIDTTKFSKKALDEIRRIDEAIAKFQAIQNNDWTDKDLIQAFTAHTRITKSYDGYLGAYKRTTTEFLKIQRSLFTSRGFDVNTDTSKIEADLQKELQEIQEEAQYMNTDEFSEKILANIVSEKKKYKVKSGNLEDRVNDFASLNYLLSYEFSDVDHSVCSIPTKELIKEQPDREKEAVAIALAMRMKIKILKLKSE